MKIYWKPPLDNPSGKVITPPLLLLSGKTAEKPALPR